MSPSTLVISAPLSFQQILVEMSTLDSAAHSRKADLPMSEDALGVFPFFSSSTHHAGSTQFLSICTMDDQPLRALSQDSQEAVL